MFTATVTDPQLSNGAASTAGVTQRPMRWAYDHKWKHGNNAAFGYKTDKNHENLSTEQVLRDTF
jgi:hypothetical protein